MKKILTIITFIIILKVILLWLLKVILTDTEYIESDIIQNTLNKENKNNPDITFISHKIWILKLESNNLENVENIDFNQLMLLKDYNLYNSGVLNFWKKDFKKNIFYFEKLVNKNLFENITDNQNYKDNPFLNTELFFSYLSVWNYEKAHKYNNKIISILSKDTNLSIYNFYINYYNYIDKEKVELYLKYLEKNNIENNIIYWDIFFLSQINKNDKATEYYNLALLENINKEYIYNQLWLIQDYEYDYKNSLELYKKSFKVDKNNLLTLKNLCISRYLNYKYLVLNKEKTENEKNIIKKWSNEAISYCDFYLEKEKKDKYVIWDAETYKYIWHIYNLWLWNNEKAEYFYLKAIKINPYDYKSYNNLSAIYRQIFENNNNENTLFKYIEYAKKAFQINSSDFFRENFIISYNVAINYYSKINNYSKFKEYSDKALKLDTINFWIKKIITSKKIYINNKDIK